MEPHLLLAPQNNNNKTPAIPEGFGIPHYLKATSANNTQISGEV